jgi:excisionase family DNA binding protein
MGNAEDRNGNEMNHEPPIDSKTAAAYLNIHYKTLERMARVGEVPATKSGRSWQFLRSLLRKWLKERMNSNLNKRRPSKNDEEKANET